MMQASQPNSLSADRSEPAPPAGLDVLFRPIRIKSLALPNRIVMAPMGRLFAPGNVLDPAHFDYYRRRVEGGTGLIIGEASGIDPIAVSHKTSPFFFGDAPLQAWKQAVDTIHAVGGRFMPQLWHAGLARVPENAANSHLPSIGPSGWYIPDADSKLRRQPGRQIGEPMTQAEIDVTVRVFGDAAAAAMAIGCDGVEVHGAHGYLIDQFLWPDMNRRTDAYGGDMAGRVRFAVEIVREIRRRTREDFPISFRYSQWKIQDYEARIVHGPQDLEAMLTPLVDAGVDMFHCSTRRFWEPAFDGSDMNLAAWTRKVTGLPTIAVGSVGLDGAFGVGSDDGSYSENLSKSAASGQMLDLSRPARLDRLIEMMERGDFDLVAIGRALIANPNWATLVRSARFDQLRAYHRQLLLSLA